MEIHANPLKTQPTTPLERGFEKYFESGVRAVPPSFEKYFETSFWHFFDYPKDFPQLPPAAASASPPPYQHSFRRNPHRPQAVQTSVSKNISKPCFGSVSAFPRRDSSSLAHATRPYSPHLSLYSRRQLPFAPDHSPRPPNVGFEIYFETSGVRGGITNAKKPIVIQ